MIFKEWLDKGLIEYGKTKDYIFAIADWRNHQIDDNNGFCGYVAFKKYPFKYDCEHTQDLINSICVHGGITFNRQLDDCYVFGFDTVHAFSDQYPNKDISWLKNEIELMYKGLLFAKKWENKYHKFPSMRKKIIANMVKYCESVAQNSVTLDSCSLSMSLKCLIRK